jgi:hypothetical protein
MQVTRNGRDLGVLIRLDPSLAATNPHAIAAAANQSRTQQDNTEKRTHSTGAPPPSSMGGRGSSEAGVGWGGTDAKSRSGRASVMSMGGGGSGLAVSSSRHSVGSELSESTQGPLRFRVKQSHAE